MNATQSFQTIDVQTWMGTDILGSRDQGRQLRTFLAERIDQMQSIVLDFISIDVMTSAFTDECFGKLWDSFGAESVKAIIHIRGLTGNNKAIFRFVLANR